MFRLPLDLDVDRTFEMTSFLPAKAEEDENAPTIDDAERNRDASRNTTELFIAGTGVGWVGWGGSTTQVRRGK
eukprot:CAMPEP_0183305516 /NCGR_PEP_ID=MMETSP0160_2-20130417/10221_1 /TAXON_ID=2839 ORGANISM="Odontella Sinensis, Strain Grunow 1884" /NCGR_SAMPLE_ID=MMETSP0160_2 /ASSEMBLY_ACC=CAM_ASM_000250 /LENGTH=72 /DNA_ID=CAMNT_0025468717 /DNA_START=275 /DNA_END=493 /DNA_ORIENTATION=+